MQAQLHVNNGLKIPGTITPMIKIYDWLKLARGKIKPQKD